MRSDMPTGDLLRKLLHDPRVLSAEPNYLGYVAEEDSDNIAGEETPVMEPEVEPEEVPTDLLPDENGKVEEVPVEGAEPESETVAEEEPVDLPDPEVEAETEVEPEPELEEAFDDTDAPTLTAQSDPADAASQDLTGYQWFSNGAAGTTSQFTNWINPVSRLPTGTCRARPTRVVWWPSWTPASTGPILT